MRTTLALTEDAFLIAKHSAQTHRISLGDAVSELIRQGFKSLQQTAPTPPKTVSKYALMPARNELITNDHVRDLMEAEGL